MAATPPHQIRTEIHTPPTPLHGAAHDNLESPPRRHSARLSQRRIPQESGSTPEAPHLTPRKSRTFGTPTGSKRTSQNSNSGRRISSPRSSPKHRPTRRTQVPSPSSPDSDSTIPKPTTSSHLRSRTFLPSHTTMADGMLPTPVKTPKKKIVPTVNGAARALFQDQPLLGQEVAPPKRVRKQRRYNGFSLESFTADDASQQGRIQIFTDSRDQVPEPVTNDDNPFADKPLSDGGPSAKRVAGGIKRRKISGEKKKDPQVEEAISRDDGMVYVFRGKKVYRRFDDMDEEEEVIDTEDLGLLERLPDGAERLPMKTLTRKSIKPKRLFQTEQQKKEREAEKERELSTDIEDTPDQSAAPGSSTIGGVEVVDLVTTVDAGRVLRSPKKTVASAGSSQESAVEKAKEHQTNTGSPFASWRRVKSGAGPSSATATKGTKRGASEVEGGASTKRARAD